MSKDASHEVDAGGQAAIGIMMKAKPSPVGPHRAERAAPSRPAAGTYPPPHSLCFTGCATGA